MAGNPGCVTETDDAAERLRMAMSRFIIGYGDRLNGHFREKVFTLFRVQGQVCGQVDFHEIPRDIRLRQELLERGMVGGCFSSSSALALKNHPDILTLLAARALLPGAKPLKEGQSPQH